MNDVSNKEDFVKVPVVERDGKQYLEIPESLLNEMGWSMEDDLIWEELEEGRWGIKKRGE